jgi:putative DNA primase/helicase
MVVLRGTPGSCSKVWTKTDSGALSAHIDMPYRWKTSVLPINGFRGLYATLRSLAARDDCIVIKEALRDDALLGELTERRGPASGGNFVQADRHWMSADIDSLPIPTVVRDLSYSDKVSWLTEQMPKEFRDASVVAQLTSSEGVKVTDGSTLRVRLWWWLKKPAKRSVVKSIMRAWSEKIGGGVVDLSVYNMVQPIFVNTPRFVGIADPLLGTERVFIVPGHGSEEVDNTNWPDEPDAADNADLDDERFAKLYNGVVPSETEINERVTMILNQKTKDSRHNHALAAIIELRAIGAPRFACEVVFEEILGRPKGKEDGRVPTRTEIADAIAAADQRILSGKARIDRPAVSSLFAQQEAKEADPRATPEVDGNDIMKEGPAALFAMCDDWTGAQHYKAQVYPNGGYIRWEQQDYNFNGINWEVLEAEALKARIQRYTKLTTRKAGSLRESLRSLCHEENLHPPCLITTGAAMPHMMICRNGVLNIDAWLKDPKVALGSHFQDLFSFNAVPFDFDPTAKAPEFHKFLESIWPITMYADQRREFQKMLGYVLLGDNRYQKMFVLCGASRGGKGVICSDIIENLVGSTNVSTSTLSSLGESFGLEGLEGKRVMFLPEANEQSRNKINSLAVDRLKSITGNDELTINRKNLLQVHRRLPLKVIISCNRMPKFTDPSGALQRRTVLFDFVTSFEGREDAELGTRIAREMPGVLNYALAGLRILLTEDNRFVESEASKRMRKTFLRATAPTQAFVADCLVAGSQSDTVSQGDVYEAYRAWLSKEGYDYHMTRPDFVAEVERIFAGKIAECRPRGDTAGARPMGWKGLALTSLGTALVSGEDLPFDLLS